MEITKHLSIEEIIVEVQGGQEEAYKVVVETFQRQIYTYCFRLLGNHEEAEDAAQEVFVRAYISIQQYKLTFSFSAWLYRIAHNYCLNQLRKHKHYLSLIRFYRQERVSESPEDIYEKRAFSPSLEHALKSLTPEERSLLILRVFEERSYLEIGEIVGKRPEALKKRIERLKKKVRNQITKWEEHDTWAEERKLIKTRI